MRRRDFVIVLLGGAVLTPREGRTQQRSIGFLSAASADAFAPFVAAFRSAFPDMHWAIEEQIGEGEKVVSRLAFTGTHRGEYMGLGPTGRSVTYDEIFVFRFVDGRIAETWGVVDVLSQMRQLGVFDQRRGQG